MTVSDDVTPAGRTMVRGSRADRRIQQITDAATRLFVERGYEETSVQDVAESIGMLKGSLYYYMRTKEDLLFWVLRGNHQRLRATVVESAGFDGLAPLERIRTFVRRHVSFVLEHAAISALYAQKFSVLESTPQHRREIIELRRSYENFLVSLIAECHAEPATAAGADPVLTGRALLAMCNAAHAWFHPGGHYTREQIVEHHAELAVRAVGRSG
jgi:TetR/AcrR family transcriptional regulator, cholesterol catabolism regulator